MSAWSATPIIDWLLHKGRHLPGPEQLLGELCRRVAAAGMPLDRVGVFIRTLHPQYFGVVLRWEGGAAQMLPGEHALLGTDAVRRSPFARIQAGERVIRRRLEAPGCPLDFPVRAELEAAGYTDYVVVELVFGSGARNSVSLASRRPGGFSPGDIEEVERLLHLFALLMENHTNRGIASNLMDTYLGTLSGRRVLEGRIRRGDGEEIDAVIWFSDLRGSTELAERLEPRRYLDLLNDYFEATAGAVLAHRGEVLRFVGDASLAVFPIVDGTASRASVCREAVSAARTAQRRAEEVNGRRRQADLPPFEYGIGLHLGEVLYGNVGTPGRLEFTVIGAAANETARIEGLSKLTGERVVVSGALVEHLAAEAPWPSLGRHRLAGVGRDVEVFALPPRG